MKIILAEKPDMALKISQAIGNMKRFDGYFCNNEYIVTFAFGHLFVLKSIDQYLNREKTKWNMTDIPFVPDKFEYILKDDTGVKKQYQIIKELYKRENITGIINAGDPDREGSVIILNIIHNLEKETGRKLPVMRAWLKATKSDAIRNSLNDLHPEEYYGNNYEEGLARTYSDWLYGINFTRYLTLKTGRLLPAGRVLIPIVKYVYDRDCEIKNFEKKKYYEIGYEFTKDGESIKGDVKNCRYPIEDRDKALKTLEYLKNQKAFVKKITKKKIKKQPPKLFSLDTLQNKLSVEEKMTSAETLSIVQKLYEEGYVTYPRTNTEYLVDEEIPSIEKLVNQLFEMGYSLKMKTNKSIFCNEKTEGHTALIITDKFPDEESLSEKERLVYKTIKRRFLSNFCKEETIVEETEVTIAIEEYDIQIKGNVVVEKGFYEYEEPQKEKILPRFEEGEQIILELELNEKETTPPKRVTEAELNQFLKNPYKRNEIANELEKESDNEEYRLILEGCQIGTVATRAGIIENALKYEYIKREKNHLTITEIGEYYIEVLNKLGIDLDKEKTVSMNMMLKKVFKNECRIEDVVSKTSMEISKVIGNNNEIEIKKIEKEGIGKCPFCGGNVYEGEKNYYCSKYKEGCNLYINKVIASKKITKLQVKQLLEKKRTNIVKGFVSSKNTKFDAKLKLTDDRKVSFDFQK